jgi:signal transduction histidine kinase
MFGNSDRLMLTIQDDGTGFDSKVLDRRGLGLVGMEERVREAGGAFSVESQPGSGTTVHVEIPVKKGANHA